MTPEEKREYNRLAQQKRRLKPEVRDKERTWQRLSENSKRHSATTIAWQRDPKNWLKVILRNIKYRAKKKGLEFSLTSNDIVVPEYCPVLGIKLEFVRNQNAILCGTSPSIDRVDNTKGYTKDNIQVISMRANHIKRDMSFEEIEKLYFYMKEYLS